MTREVLVNQIATIITHTHPNYRMERDVYGIIDISLSQYEITRPAYNILVLELDDYFRILLFEFVNGISTRREEIKLNLDGVIIPTEYLGIW